MGIIYKIMIISFFAGFVLSQIELRSNSPFNLYLHDTVLVNGNDSAVFTIDSLGINEQNLSAGKKLYKSKCGRCHLLHEPDEYKQKQWKRNLNEMKEKAELSKEQYSLILRYLYSKSKK